jgi:magnesium transporter
MPTEIITQGRVTWTNVIDHQPEDIQQLSQRYPTFHPLNLQDCLTEREIPKLDYHDQYLFIVVQLPVRDPQDQIYHPAEVDIFISKGTLVTSHRGNLQPLNDLFAQAKTNLEIRTKLMDHGASPLLYRLLDELVNTCYPILRQVLADLRNAESTLFSENVRHLLNEIALVRRDIISLKHILAPQQDVIWELEKGNWDFIHEDLDLYWGDIKDHLVQLVMMLDESSEMISGLSETADTLASHRIDDVVRLLTVVTVLTLPLTLISTLFGMNIELPFSRHPLLFYLIIISGFLMILGLLWYFRKRHWF